MTNPKCYKSARIGLILLNLNLIFFSFILIIFGLSESVSLGVLEKYGVDSGNSERLKLPPSPSSILMTLGFITIITGTCGLRSVDKYCALVAYAIFVILLAFVDISIGISADFVEVRTRNGMGLELMESLKHFNRTNEYSIPEIEWDRMQSELRCCGVFGPEDWQPVFNNKTIMMDDSYDTYDPGSSIPSSCFLPANKDLFIVMENGGQAINEEGKENIFNEGCLDNLVDLLGIGRLKRIGLILATGKGMAGMAAIFVALSLRKY